MSRASTAPRLRAVSACHERPPRQSRFQAVSACHEHPPRQSRSRAVFACHERPPRQSRLRAVSSQPRAQAVSSHAQSASPQPASQPASLAHPVCTTPPSPQPAPHRRPPSQPRTPGLHPQPASHARSAAQRNGNPFLSPSSQLVSLGTLRENLKKNPSIRDAFGKNTGSVLVGPQNRVFKFAFPFKPHKKTQVFPALSLFCRPQPGEPVLAATSPQVLALGAAAFRAPEPGGVPARTPSDPAKRSFSFARGGSLSAEARCRRPQKVRPLHQTIEFDQHTKKGTSF